MKELATVKNGNKALRDDLKQEEIVIERYDGELKRYRSEPFLGVDFKGMRPYAHELVELLKQGGTLDSFRLLKKLGTDPRRS